MKKIFVAAVLVVAVLFGCSGGKPSDVVKSFYKNIEAGKVNDAYEFLAKDTRELMSQLAGGPSALAEQTEKMKQKGGIKQIDVVKEEITGDTAMVVLKLTCGNGKVEETKDKLVKEDGKWKMAVNK